jgi:MFS family permease
MSSTFRSLAGINYRLWFAGALVSNIGTWMQRTAQDWIVLTELTDHDAVAVGITMALQLGPQLLLVPVSGLIADRFDKRRLLLATNLTMGVLAAGLGALTLSGAAELWQVYLFALALGVTSAIDAPARQAFVSELVSERNLPNAVSLNSASFNGARLVGPAAAGILTASVGAGWVFSINALTFAATLIALLLMHRDELRPAPRAASGRGQLLKGLSYVASRADLIVIFIIVFLIGTFGLNFAIFTSTMASVEFNHGAGEFGLLSSVLAIGSVAGALLSARRERPRMRTVILSAGAFGVSLAIASVMPTYWSFAIALVLVGFSGITLMTTANGVVQTRTAPEMRGRVMALYLAIFMGGTPLGAPIVGYVANELGPRWAIGVGATAGVLAALVGLVYLVRERGLRLRYDGGFSLTWTDRDRAAEKLAADESAVPRG